MKDFTELTTPQPLVKRLLEADIQYACVAYARSKGAYSRKFSSPANRSVPDYIFLLNGAVFFVEFKKPHGVPTEAQLKEHEAIKYARGHVYVVDSVAYFKEIVQAHS